MNSIALLYMISISQLQNHSVNFGFKTSISCFNSYLSSKNLWHLRLGHPTFSVMKSIFTSCTHMKLTNKTDFILHMSIRKITPFLCSHFSLQK